MSDEILIWESYTKSLQNESTSSLRRLYHYTSLQTISEIVKSNTFELTFAYGPNQLKNKGFDKNFYLSTSSIPTGGYGTYQGKYYRNNIHCLIELDASKISDNYQIVPVDYWYDSKTGNRMNTKDENEERIISRKPSIPNAKKYIIAVHIYRPSDKNENEFVSDYINQIAQSGVDYYIYDNPEEFAALRKNKAHKLTEPHQYKLKETKRVYDHVKKIPDIINYFIDPSVEIDEKVKNQLDRHWLFDDLFSTLDIAVHDAKKVKTPEVQQALYKLSEFMRKNKKNLLAIAKDKFSSEKN
jgi:hypothetical protein